MTVFAAMLCGPWVGAVAGGLTNVVTGIANPVNFAFIPVNILVGLVTGFLARKKMFSVWWKWILSMLIMAAVSIISAAPIVVLVYGGGSFPRPPTIRATGLTKKFLQPSPVNRMRKLNQGMIWVNNC